MICLFANNVNVFLLVYAVAPKIDRKNLRKITVKEGEPIYLDVKVSGEPAPDVAWYCHGRPLQVTPVKRVDNVPYNTKLYNDNPERKDSGTYKITAQNQYGQDAAEFQIVVIGKYRVYFDLLNIVIQPTVHVITVIGPNFQQLNQASQKVHWMYRILPKTAAH